MASSRPTGPEYLEVQLPAIELLRDHLDYQYANGESLEFAAERESEAEPLLLSRLATRLKAINDGLTDGWPGGHAKGCAYSRDACCHDPSTVGTIASSRRYQGCPGGMVSHPRGSVLGPPGPTLRGSVSCKVHQHPSPRYADTLGQRRHQRPVAVQLAYSHGTQAAGRVPCCP